MHVRKYDWPTKESPYKESSSKLASEVDISFDPRKI